MIITHEFHEFIITDGNRKYFVRHNLILNTYFVREIVVNESHPDRNVLEKIEVSDVLESEIIELVKKNKKNG